jgi:solute carrier family 6 GABA transporter-like protein 1
MFNTMSSILNNNLEPWNKVIFNRSYAPKEEFFKNNSQFTDFCHTIKLLPIDDLENFTGIGDNNSSTSILQENGKLFNQLRQHCINVTTKTPAEEYWECVKSIIYSTSITFFLPVFIYFYRRRVLMLSSGIEDIGGMQWELLFLLGLSWILIYVILGKGLSQSGKVLKYFLVKPKIYYSCRKVYHLNGH